MKLIFIAIVVGILYYVLKDYFKPSDTKKCPRCEGKGFWYGARGRETCDWCKGEGRLPKDDPR